MVTCNGNTMHATLRTLIVAAAALLGAAWVDNARALETAAAASVYPGTLTPQQLNELLLRGDGAVHVWPVRQGGPNEASVYMLVGAGANITVQAGANGVLLVNSGKQAMSEQVLTALQSITRAPLRTIIETNADPEVTGGNRKIGATGQSVTGGDVANLIGSSSGITAILASQEVLDRVSAPGGRDATPVGTWPTDTYTGATKDFWFNGESIRIYRAPLAHSDGDSMVYFRHSDVVSAGDVYSTARYPMIDLERGGSIQGVIDALNRLIYEVMIPGPQNDGGTVVIPNYGRLSGYSDVVLYQETLIIIRDRIQHLVEQKKSLQQVLAANTTFEFDPRYGATTGNWTTADFVTAVYKGLVAQRKGAGARKGGGK
jgi:glyoxylase-like metal-dependent hydrolase (beta-lactamase superfamily II)